MGTINDLALFNFLWQGFVLSDEAQKAADPAIMYYGYVDKEGKFYVMESNTTNGTYQFYAGDKDYTTYWAARESLTYKRFYDVF